MFHWGLSQCYSVLSLLTQRPPHRRGSFDSETNEVWFTASILEVRSRIPHSCDKLEMEMETFFFFFSTSTSVSTTLRNNDLHRQKMGNSWGGRNSDRKEHRNDSWEQTGWELTTSCCYQHSVTLECGLQTSLQTNPFARAALIRLQLDCCGCVMDHTSMDCPETVPNIAIKMSDL